MPHLIVEYSANLQKHADIPGLVRAVHEAALASGLFKTAAVRTRAERRDVYAIADEHPQNAFVAIAIRIARGRTETEKQRLSQSIFDAACRYLDKNGAHGRLAISLEIEEIVELGALRRNDLHSLSMEPSQPVSGARGRPR